MTKNNTNVLREVADTLFQAARDLIPIAPVRHLLCNDVATAYEVQEKLITKMESATNTRVGRKIGLTSEAVQKQLGVEQPDFGVLLKEMDASDWDAIPISSLIKPRIEAEIAFIIGEDVNDPANVLQSIAAIHPALEIVDSRIKNWDISIIDTIADNASCGLFMISKNGFDPGQINTVTTEMTLEIDGEVRSKGTGAACLKDPKNALKWVAETSHRLGRPLRAGEIVLSGALGPMVDLEKGMRIKAHFSQMGFIETKIV